MKYLRERCKSLCESLERSAIMDYPAEMDYSAAIDLIESFAREIRNQVIDEALEVLNCRGTSCPIPTRAMCNNPYHRKILALKTTALAAGRLGENNNE